MKARNFFGDADKFGKDDSYVPFSGEKVVELGIDKYGELTFTIDSKNQNLYITDYVTFKINDRTKAIYENFKIFVNFNKDSHERILIQTENRQQLSKIFYGSLSLKDMEKKNTLKFELECIRKGLSKKKIRKQKKITILPHPGDTLIFTKII